MQGAVAYAHVTCSLLPPGARYRHVSVSSSCTSHLLFLRHTACEVCIVGSSSHEGVARQSEYSQPALVDLAIMHAATPSLLAFYHALNGARARARLREPSAEFIQQEVRCVAGSWNGSALLRRAETRLGIRRCACDLSPGLCTASVSPQVRPIRFEAHSQHAPQAA